MLLLDLKISFPSLRTINLKLILVFAIFLLFVEYGSGITDLYSSLSAERAMQTS